MDFVVQWFRDTWKQPAAADVAYRELVQAERNLLAAQSGVEYAQAMVEYESKRVTRLREYLRKVEWETV